MATQSLFRPDVRSFGFALFLTTNATALWGGAFPFLPLSFQTAQVIIGFFLAQSISLWGTFGLFTYLTYRLPKINYHLFTAQSVAFAIVGGIFLIAALYLDRIVTLCVILGGVFMGSGCAGFFILWQRLFAAQDDETGAALILVANAIAPVMYFCLYLIPNAVTAFLVPLIFIPICALCLSLGTRNLALAQPMFEDVPQENARVYAHAVKDCWRGALCVAALGLASGAIRSLTLSSPALGDIVNSASMIGALIASLACIYFWRTHSFSFNITQTFKVIFPVLISGFILLPFLGGSFTYVFSAGTHTVFVIGTILVMIHSAQLARSRGLNPCFIFAFFMGAIYLLQGLGFLLGFFSSSFEALGFEQLSIVSLICIYFTSIILFVCYVGIRTEGTSGGSADVNLEFMALSPSPRKSVDIESLDADVDNADTKLKDLTSKKCLIIQQRYRLTPRETEIMEHVTRGYSVPQIAETLFVSENTVRTHSKNIYQKLGIHKRRELLDIFESIEIPGERSKG